MQLNELKTNMSVLNQVLAHTSNNIRIDRKVSQSAHTKLLIKFRQTFISCLITGCVFLCMWLGNVDPEKLPNIYKAYVSIMCLAASGWYHFLYRRLKGINIAVMTPARFICETSKIKLLTLTGEIFFGLALTVFFTLLLSFFLNYNLLAFRMTVGLLTISIIAAVIYTWPRYIKLFNDLNSIKE